MKSGFVSLVGRPNVGKSTLMNLLLGEKIAITSYKPQTTRNRIQGVLTEEGSQIIFLDTPGIHRPEHRLGEYMMKEAEEALRGVDFALFLVEAGPVREEDLLALDKLKKSGQKAVLVINKIDTLSRSRLIESAAAFEKLHDFLAVVPVSAKTGENTEELLKVIRANLPEGPLFFPEDTLTDQPEKQLSAELIREKVLLFTQDEIPHGVAVLIDRMCEREDQDLLDIEASIVCERRAHKLILIGKGGAMIQKIGTAAREDIERLLDIRVNLQLFVKVRERWRDSDIYIKNYGYES